MYVFCSNCPFQLNTNSSDPLGDESTLSDLATDASSEPIVIDPDSDSVEKAAAGNLNSSSADGDADASSSSSMATPLQSSSSALPGAADSIEVEENPIGSGDEQPTHRSGYLLNNVRIALAKKKLGAYKMNRLCYC